MLATIVERVYTVERMVQLAATSAERLARLGYRNVQVLHGGGTLGWAEHAPYEAIIAAAGGPSVPPALLDQLPIGGRLVMPVGSHGFQYLVRVRRLALDDYSHEQLEGVAFVPLIGEQGWPDRQPATSRLTWPPPSRPFWTRSPTLARGRSACDGAAGSRPRD